MIASKTSASAQADSSDAGSASSKFVPIRPAFRPLLPKPSAAAGAEPTVVLKSHSRSGPKVMKKRKSDAGPLAHSVAPSSLVTKRRKSPPASGMLDRPRRRNTGDSRTSDDELVFSSKEGSVSPPDSKGLVSPSLDDSLASSTLSLSMLSTDTLDGPLYAAAAAKSVLTSGLKSKPVLVPASPPSSEQSDIRNEDVLLSSALEVFIEPMQDLALDFSQQSALASPTEQFDALEGIDFDDIDVQAFLAPTTEGDDADANGFDPMEIFGPRLDIF